MLGAGAGDPIAEVQPSEWNSSRECCECRDQSGSSFGALQLSNASVGENREQSEGEQEMAQDPLGGGASLVHTVPSRGRVTGPRRPAQRPARTLQVAPVAISPSVAGPLLSHFPGDCSDVQDKRWASWRAGSQTCEGADLADVSRGVN